MASALRSVSSASTWLGLAASAFLCADLLAAGLERSLSPPAAPYEVGSPALATPGGAEGLPVVFRQPTSRPLVPSARPAPGSRLEVPAAPSVAPPPQGVSLRGTLVGAGGRRLALIEAEGSVQALSVGGAFGEHEVVRIEPTWVLLSRRGQLSRLALESAQVAELRLPSSPAPAPPAALPPLGEVQDPALLQAAGGLLAAGGRLSLEEIRTLLDNPAEVARTFRVVPVSRDDQAYGVQIEFRQAQNLMATFGMRDGDILLSLNGQPIRNAEDVYKAYLAIRNSPALDFEVDRGGAVTAIRYELEE